MGSNIKFYGNAKNSSKYSTNMWNLRVRIWVPSFSSCLALKDVLYSLSYWKVIHLIDTINLEHA